MPHLTCWLAMVLLASGPHILQAKLQKFP